MMDYTLLESVASHLLSTMKISVVLGSIVITISGGVSRLVKSIMNDSISSSIISSVILTAKHSLYVLPGGASENRISLCLKI